MASSDLYLTTEGELTSVADAIRSKGGASGLLVYPDEYIVAIQNISTGSVIVTETEDVHGGIIVEITGGTLKLQSKSVTPTTSAQVVAPDNGYNGLSQVNLAAIPSEYIIPTGTVNITSAGTTDVTAYASASVSSTTLAQPTVSINSSGLITASVSQTAGFISASSSSKTLQLTTQAAKTVTPTTSSQTAVASQVYTTGTVTVAAIPSQYKDISGVTATASDVLSGKSFVNSSGTTTNGTLVIQHYYTGSGTPSSSTGSNGDIYLKTS